MMLVVVPGFTTRLSQFLQSLVPSRSRKYPISMERLESSRLRKATEEHLRGSAISPYCPGSTVPKLSWLGNFKRNLLFIPRLYHNSNHFWHESDQPGPPHRRGGGHRALLLQQRGHAPPEPRARGQGGSTGDASQKIWNSGSGLPQFITISLEEVKDRYTQIERIGFYCWHDYTTNPKTIEVEVAPSIGEKMVLWCRLTLKQKSGKQLFDITPLPASYKIIKVAIVETFGEYETYLNQIYLFAEVDKAMHSELAVNDLESPSNSYNHYQKEHSQEEEQFEENTFHNKQTYAGPQRIHSPSSKYSEQQELDHSLQNDVALLTLSKNVMEMEENIEEIKRSLEVLTVRVDMTYDKLQKKIMEKVEALVDTKLLRMKQQIKNQLKRSSLRDSKSQQQIDFLRSVDYEEQPRPVREAKQSLHIHNLKSNRVEPKQSSQSKNPVVSELMTKLAKKLQQRLKVKKIESKRGDRPNNK